MAERIGTTITKAISANRQQDLSPECRQKTTLLYSRFGDRNSFLAKCNPDVQTIFARHPDRCYFGDYPTLSEINGAYGKTMAAQWLTTHLTNLSEFSGAKDVTVDQLNELSRIIAQEYHWLKVTELLLFFYKFKTGCYGRFYGSVDPLVITTALREFVRDRNSAHIRHEQEERERKEAEERKLHPPITWEQWQKIKEKRTNRQSLTT